MLVLAFGAQVVAGDGDHGCPRDVARVWSEVLQQHALEIMKGQSAYAGGADIIKLWIVYAAYSRSYGKSGGKFEGSSSVHARKSLLISIRLHIDGLILPPPPSRHPFADELSAMSTAARQLTRMGLHRSGVHDIVANHANDHRMLFVVSFYFEKWACLCHGAPTTLIWSPEADEIVNGLPEVSSRRSLTFHDPYC